MNLPAPNARPSGFVRHGAAALLAGLAALFGLLLPAHAAIDEEFTDKFLMLGTGPVGGAFRPIGESLCDAVNEDRSSTLVRCVPVATAGSTFNLHAVANGAIQLGIAQEDLLAQMQADRRQSRGRALRVIAVLHTSPIAVMARQSAGITQLRQIAGKHLNLGNRGSGQFAIVAALMQALDLRQEDLGASANLATSEFERAFCEGKVDVVVEAVAHPSPLFDKLRACGGEFVDIPPDVVARMMASNRWLSPMEIAAGTYEGQARPVHTLGMRNVLFSSSAVHDVAVQHLTGSLRRHYADLLRAQPLLGSMTRLEQTDTASLPAPMHAGAARAMQLPLITAAAP